MEHFKTNLIDYIIVSSIIIGISIWRFYASFGRKHSNGTFKEQVDDILVIPAAVLVFIAFGIMTMVYYLLEFFRRKKYRHKYKQELIGTYVSKGGSFPVGDIDHFKRLISVATENGKTALYIEYGSPIRFQDDTDEEYRDRVSTINLRRVVGYIDNITTISTNGALKVYGDLYFNTLGQTMYNEENMGLCLRGLMYSGEISKIFTWDLGLKDS